MCSSDRVDTEDYMQCNHCRTALSARRQCLKCVCVLPCVLPCGTAPRGCVLERARGVWAVDGVRARESGQCTRGSSAAPGSMNGARWNLPRERDTLQLHSVVPRGMPVLAKNSTKFQPRLWFRLGVMVWPWGRPSLISAILGVKIPKKVLNVNGALTSLEA